MLGLLFLWPVLLECKDGRWEPLEEGDVMASQV